ncbi:EamA family transporter [Pyxidicoccus fallax]|uniref:EamA family transporter n=1 Tax=Pyxidicoccus fallax TaxID=394095 RepID=A0A848LD71_9BACT|nr:DMT family transporter [Pyxidicoccus fallax]NMO16949.1 EamA family transporter [Pyxidicoccus fallax]NPC84992.1 EamA family transporter [Pyxidicoccus fallax]
MGAQPARTLTSSTAASPLTLVYALMCVQVLISAGTYLTGKRAMMELPPLTVVMWRFLLSGSVFVLLLWLSPGPKVPPREEWRRVFILGLLAGPVNQGFFFYGLSKSTAAHAALLYALTPLGVYLLSLGRGQERASLRAVAGIVTAFAGVVVLLLGRGLADASGSLMGDLLILGAVAAWVVYTTEGKPFVAAHGPVRATAWSMVASTVLMLPMAPFMAKPEQVLAASTAAKGSIVYLGLLTSVVAYLIWYYALSKVPASKVAIFSNLQPAATALAAWALLDEELHWAIAVGGVLVLLGVRLTQMAHVRPPPASPLPGESGRQAA